MQLQAIDSMDSIPTMRPDWQSSTAPDLVTSTVHNPRTLAATSDPGTHDPTAATSWGALVAL